VPGTLTRRLPPTPEGLAEAASLLRAGRLVAFGTETVYGLGARADRADSIAAIYVAKSRPSDNPLILHYKSLEDAAPDVDITPQAQALARAFWPGPLTLVLRRRPGARPVPEVGPGETLAIRVPNQRVALDLFARVGVPIAAPSANPSGGVSPTRAAHVLAGLDGRIDAVLDSGPCAVGLESTVLDISGPRPVLLRPGAVAPEAIAAIAGAISPRDALAPVRSPGMQSSHYAPSAPLRLRAARCGPDEALLAFGTPLGTPGAVFQLSLSGNTEEAAARLYEGLHSLDQTVSLLGLRGIAAMDVPEAGIGAAINDRLRRAATRGR
jgi:L-threonylcarbamoyladenylate synthase